MFYGFSLLTYLPGMAEHSVNTSVASPVHDTSEAVALDVAAMGGSGWAG